MRERNSKDIQFVANVIYGVEKQSAVTIARAVLDAMEDAGMYSPSGVIPRRWRRRARAS